ncbi:hypothetical protein [Thermogymnomonas acidicola]|uniref:hypothetical protein n=1 Tax=Thermogymnomonas acidicola TaxID=399579 RepID=UPI000946480B|nr:hypothetical protein [Thermogymnomonas acidicola]
MIEGLFGLTPDPWLGLQDALTGRLPEGWPSGRATIGNINYRGTRYTIVLGKDGARLEEEAAWQERSR